MTGVNRPTLLLTGFGPFPRVPDNPSIEVALAAARRLAIEAPDLTVELLRLPTVWDLAPDMVAAAIDRLKPDALIHLGVARRTRHLALETRARNFASPITDADDRLPRLAELVPGGPPEIDNTRAASALLRQLAAAGLKVARAGRASSYVCNAVYYRSLWMMPAGAGPLPVMFMHLPADLRNISQRPTLADAVTASVLIARAMAATALR